VFAIDQPASPAQMSPHGEKPLILVVDDIESVRQLLVTAIDDAGYGTVSAPNGVAALLICRARPVALVIMDLVMPEMEGFETMDILHQEFPDLPIIAMSGHEGNLLNAARHLGADAIMAKPIDVRLLLQTIGRLCNAGGSQSTT